MLPTGAYAAGSWPGIYLEKMLLLRVDDLRGLRADILGDWLESLLSVLNLSDFIRLCRDGLVSPIV